MNHNLHEISGNYIESMISNVKDMKAIIFDNETQVIFSLEFSLFEIDKNNTYITAFIESAGFNQKNEELSNSTTILKFHINSFTPTNQRVIEKSVTINGTYDGRCVSAFRLDDSKLIVIIIVERTGEKRLFEA